MGRKVHPIGYRLGHTTRWESTWYADRDYTALLLEDIEIRNLVRKYLEAPGGRDARRGGGRRRGGFGAGVSKIEIERNVSQARVVIHTARPGIVIGRGGSNREEIQKQIQKQTGRRVVVDVQEIDQPELDAFLVARNVADQLERRVSFRRAIKMTAERTMRAGADGVKIMVAGRLGGREMSRTEFEILGTVPLQTLDANIDYGLAEARTTAGRIGVKAWVHRGNMREQAKLLEEQVSRPAPSGRRPAART